MNNGYDKVVTLIISMKKANYSDLCSDVCINTF